jgi:predicted DNA-binding transcriptional regulator AlpA
MKKNKTSSTSEILSAAEAAVFLGLSYQYLANLRWSGKGPQFKKIGHAVVYTRSALVEWLGKK